MMLNEFNLSRANSSWLMLHKLYEDEDLLIINKPVGLTCESARSNQDVVTLEDIIQNQYPFARFLPRSGIIHRLDKETTGCLIVAKNLPCLQELKNQFIAKTIMRFYYGLTHTTPNCIQGRISTYLKKSYPSKTMQVLKSYQPGAKLAVTYYERCKIYKHYCLLRFKLETGRTHQIRAHMQYIKCPLVGDRVYNIYQSTIPHQLLHAFNLCFQYQKKHIDVIAPMPDTFNQTLCLLENDGSYRIP